MESEARGAGGGGGGSTEGEAKVFGLRVMAAIMELLIKLSVQETEHAFGGKNEKKRDSAVYQITPPPDSF